MSNKRRLWQIFGPVICAVILLVGVFLIPWERTYNKTKISEAAASQTNNIFKGQAMKQAALSQYYVPFFGSSELSRLDPLHPSVIAYKYNRNYRPFLLGGPGSQSLAQFYGMQGIKDQLSGKKAVVIVSPQWFTKQGQNPDAFSMYYSPLQAVDFLLDARDSTATRYAAERLLQMPSADSHKFIKYDLMTVAAGQKLSPMQITQLKIDRRILLNQDTFFSSFQLRDRLNHIQSQANKLPDNYSVKGLTQVADREGAKNTTNNKFRINNAFFKRELTKKELAKLKGSQKKFDYTKSIEYSDFELMLNQFAQTHTNVLFIIPPINQRWMNYTGLSQSMYQESVSKIKYQLVNQGFYNIADLSKDGGKKYFMEDTIHLGWNGWITVDQYVKDFMKRPNTQMNYDISNYYFTKAWQNRTNVPNVNVNYKDGMSALKEK